MSRKKTISISRKPTLTQDEADTAKVAYTMRSPMLPDGAMRTEGTDASDYVSLKPRYGILAKTIYGVVYSLSFGAVFGTLILWKLVPGSGMIGHAMIDGADAAKKVFKNFERKTVSGQPAEGMIMA